MQTSAGSNNFSITAPMCCSKIKTSARYYIGRHTVAMFPLCWRVFQKVSFGTSTPRVRHFHLQRGLTPLHEACLAGHRKCVYLLLSLGADIKIQTMEGYTSLMCAAGNGNEDTTSILVGAGCDGNEVIKPIGVNALHIASWTGHEDVIKVLLKLGCDPEVKSQMGKTAMEYAIEQRHTSCMEVLRNHIKKTEEKSKTDTKLFDSKMHRMKKKVIQYYEEKLQEEITYFEQQLQAQHCKDLGVIMKMTTELERVYTLLNASTNKTEKEYKPLLDVGKMPTSVAQRALSRTSMITRSSSMDMQAASRNGYYSSDYDDDEENDPLNDDEISPEPSPTSRSATPTSRNRRNKDTSITQLVEEAAQRKDSVNILRKQNSSDSDYNSLPVSPRDNVTKKGLAIPTRIASPTPPRRQRHASTPAPPRTSPRSPLTPHPPGPLSPINRQPSPRSPKPRTRRKSSGLFIRRQSLLEESADEEEKSRRKSVAVRMTASAQPRDKEPQKKKGNFLLNLPLPNFFNSERNEMNDGSITTKKE
ncbi:E3 ubiquitin-protein ligase HACE1-like isoform X2 [Anneissia japonica]|uniref:E3 ubiquitin-protein ligase HACE1-like isoform X2 n=1 Tax=Anneissia japonica TaxID=1529436 RepID=UPI0014259ABA|nr:E3 ubiquitin-protein ligase HACE1-like isoform X2 [Anneissia japonica]